MKRPKLFFVFVLAALVAGLLPGLAWAGGSTSTTTTRPTTTTTTTPPQDVTLSVEQSCIDEVSWLSLVSTGWDPGQALSVGAANLTLDAGLVWPATADGNGVVEVVNLIPLDFPGNLYGAAVWEGEGLGDGRFAAQEFVGQDCSEPATTTTTSAAAAATTAQPTFTG